jgi:hypothetical protein
MKTSISSIIILAGTLFSNAQETIIKGRVSDHQDNPIPLAHLILQGSTDQVEGTISDIDGHFLFNGLRAGSYDLKIVALGYSDYIRSVTVKTGINDLGNLRIEEASVELNEVELIAQKKIYQRRKNSLVIHVEKSIAGSGGSALDLLTNMAGIRVNNQNGSLSINGKGQAIIMLNGKPSRLDGTALTALLQGMPASNIQSLEIFSNPPAKFESNGSGGVVNIRTKSRNSNQNGGSISLSSGFGSGEKGGASVDFQIGDKKLSWFGGYSFNRSRFLEEWGLKSDFEQTSNPKFVTTTSDRKPVTNAHNYSIGLEYSFLRRTTIGGNVNGYNTKWDMIASDKVGNTDGLGNVNSFDIATKEVNQWNHISGSGYISHMFVDSTQISANYDYLHYRDNNPSSYQYELNEGNVFTQIEKETPISFHVLNLDYTGKVFEKVRMEIGGKTTISRFSNDITVSNLVDADLVIDSNLSSTTQMEENIHALYTSFSFQISDRISLTTGLRYEHTSNRTQNQEQDYHNTYNSLFPNLILSQQINTAHRLQVTYGRRINRPTFNNLAPYVLFLGPDALYSGNPVLQPSFVNMVGAEWDWGAKHLSLEYLTEKNPIVEFQPRLSTDENQYIFKAENMDHRNVLSVTFRFPWQITSWWSMENTFIYQHENIGFPFQSFVFRREKDIYRIQGSQFITLDSKTKLELSGYYQSSTLFGISTFGARGVLNVGLQHTLNRNNGTLKLSFGNMLASDNWNIRTSTLDPFVNTKETYFPESRIVLLTYTKSLGSVTKKREPRDSPSKKERERVQ